VYLGIHTQTNKGNLPKFCEEEEERAYLAKFEA
jgi:hypothetical protein